MPRGHPGFQPLDRSVIRGRLLFLQPCHFCSVSFSVSLASGSPASSLKAFPRRFILTSWAQLIFRGAFGEQGQPMGLGARWPGVSGTKPRLGGRVLGAGDAPGAGVSRPAGTLYSPGQSPSGVCLCLPRSEVCGTTSALVFCPLQACFENASWTTTCGPHPWVSP